MIGCSDPRQKEINGSQKWRERKNLKEWEGEALACFFSVLTVVLTGQLRIVLVLACLRADSPVLSIWVKR